MSCLIVTFESSYFSNDRKALPGMNLIYGASLLRIRSEDFYILYKLVSDSNLYLQFWSFETSGLVSEPSILIGQALSATRSNMLLLENNNVLITIFNQGSTNLFSYIHKVGDFVYTECELDDDCGQGDTPFCKDSICIAARLKTTYEYSCADGLVASFEFGQLDQTFNNWTIIWAIAMNPFFDSTNPEQLEIALNNIHSPNVTLDPRTNIYYQSYVVGLRYEIITNFGIYSGDGVILNLPCKCTNDAECLSIGKSACIIGITCVDYRMQLQKANYDCNQAFNIIMNPYEEPKKPRRVAIYSKNDSSFFRNITLNDTYPNYIDLSYFSQDNQVYILNAKYIGFDDLVIEVNMTMNTPCNCTSNTYCRNSSLPLCFSNICYSNISFALTTENSFKCNRISIIPSILNSLSSDLISNITWSVNSNATNATMLQSLKSYLTSQSLASFFISGEYLFEELSYYNISCSFIQNQIIMKYYDIQFISSCSCSSDLECYTLKPYCLEGQCSMMQPLSYRYTEHYQVCGDVMIEIDQSALPIIYSDFIWIIKNNSEAANFEELKSLVQASHSSTLYIDNYIENTVVYNITVMTTGPFYYNFTFQFKQLTKVIPTISSPNFSGYFVIDESIEFNSDIDLATFEANWNVDPKYNSTIIGNRLIIYYDNPTNFEDRIISLKINGLNSLTFICHQQNFTLFAFPLNGTFSISPLSGFSNYTDFTLSSSGWIGNSTISYNYYQFNSAQQDWIFLLSTINQNVQARLLADISNNVSLKVEVVDLFGSKNRAYTYVNLSNWTGPSTPNNNHNQTNSSNSSNQSNQSNQTSNTLNQLFTLIENFTLGETPISTISEMLSTFENKIASDFNNRCPYCSGHGTCDAYLVCSCTANWTGQDCSLNLTEYEEYIELKALILNELNLTTMNTSTYLQVLNDLSDKSFNNEKTMSLIQNKLNDFMSIYNQTTIPPQLLNATNSVIDNILAFTSEQDCNQTSNVTASLKNQLEQYITKVAESTLSTMSTNDTHVVYSRNTYDLYLKRISTCQIITSINLTESSFSTNLTRKTNSSSNCSDYVNVQYLAFDTTLFNCSVPSIYRTEGKKDLISIKLTDSSGKQVESSFSVTLIGTDECPRSCDSQGSVCHCDDLSIFDVKGQIFALFANSGLSKLGDFSALVDWIFYQDFSFYLISGMLSVAGVTTLLTATTFSSVSILSENYFGKLGLCKRFLVGFMVANTLFNAMFVKDRDSSKISRIFLFFVKMMIMILFTSIFNFPDNLDIELNMSISLIFAISPYTYALPYITIIPYYNLLAWLIRAPPKRTRVIKFKIFLGVFLSFATIVFCALGSFIISATKSGKQRMAWGLGIIFSCTQDLILNPILFSLIQLCLIKMLPKKTTIFSYKLCRFLIAEEMLRIYTKTKPTRISRIAPNGFLVSLVNARSSKLMVKRVDTASTNPDRISKQIVNRMETASSNSDAQKSPRKVNEFRNLVKKAKHFDISPSKPFDDKISNILDVAQRARSERMKMTFVKTKHF